MVVGPDSTMAPQPVMIPESPTPERASGPLTPEMGGVVGPLTFVDVPVIPPVPSSESPENDSVEPTTSPTIVPATEPATEPVVEPVSVSPVTGPVMGPAPELTTFSVLESDTGAQTEIRYGVAPDEVVRGQVSIGELAQTALSQNPTLSQASRLLDQARGNYVQSGLYPNPVVGYTAGELGDEGSAGKQGGFFQQRIVTGGKLRWNRAVADSEADQAYYAVEQQRLRVLNDVRAQAMEVLALQRLVELDQKLVEIGTQGLATAEQLFTAQEVSRADTLQARVERNTAQLQLDTSRADYVGAWRRLASLVGKPESPPTRITDLLEKEPEPLDWDSSLTELLERSPELAQAKAGVQRARRDLERQRVQPIPDVEISGGVLYNDVNGYTVGTAQLGVAIPVFDRNQGGIAAASASIGAEMANVRRTELDLRNRLAEAFREYQASERQCHRYRTEILPDALETLRIAQLGYQEGEFTYLQLLTAQRSYFQATRDYIGSLKNLHVSV
ncbi:MAG: TolC family protein, partial [Planctomycetia bacterium]|nr:TolC family protein [Planctomycetia bacterium]